MESNSTYNWVPLETAVSQYNLMTGEEYDLYEGLELAWACVKNHIRYFLTKDYVCDVTPKDGRIDLHGEIFEVRSVSRRSGGFDDLPPSALIHSGVAIPKVEGVEYGPGVLHEPFWVDVADLGGAPQAGPFVDFDFRGDHLCVEDKGPLRVHFRCLKLGSDGYPLITEKTAEACALYLHKIETAKRYYRKEIDINMKRESERDFALMAAEARRGDGFSENTMDAVLTAMTSWGRKRHHLPYRPQ